MNFPLCLLRSVVARWVVRTLALSILIHLIPSQTAQAAIAFRAANSASVTTGTTLTITKPTGTVSGDVMIAAIGVRPETTVISAPSGWSLIASVTQTSESGSRNRTSTYYKVAGASEAASYSWTFSASVTGAVGGILTFSGVDTTSPIHANGTNTTISLTHTANAISTSVANAMIVSVHEIPSSLSFAPPTGMTEAVDVASLARPDSLGIMLGMNYVVQSATGSTGAKTATGSPAIGSDADNGTAQLLALRPATGPTAFSINVGAGTASTCAAKSISMTAVDGSGSTVTSYTGTVNISTSTGRGDWSLVSGSGTLTNGTADDGAATYVFVAGDNGIVTLGLTYQLGQQVSVTVADSSLTISTTSSSISFSDNAFVYAEDLSNKIAGSNVAVAGRGHDYQVALYRREPSTLTNCSIATSYAGAKPLKAWITRNAADPGGAAPVIGAVSLPNAQPGANNLTLTFTSGAASFNLSTSDVGKYAINFRDDTMAVPTAAITGSSNELTLRPFAMVVSAIKRGAIDNPNANTATGTLFTQAGESLQATVGAYRHNSAADTDDDGLPDSAATLAQTTGGGLAGSYAYATSLSATSPYTPATGTLGSLGNGALVAGNFTGGSTTPATLSYSEVGSFTMALAVSNYLGTAGVNFTGTVFNVAGNQNAVVGRFTPYDFGVSLNTPNFTPGCSTNTAFTYIGQSLVYGTAPLISVTARNKSGATTRNYTGSWWKLSNTSLTGRNYTAASGTLDTTGLPANTSDPAIVDLGGASGGQGTLTFSAGTGLLFMRGATVAPFNADISLTIDVIDSDGVAYGSNPARFGTASAGNGIGFTGGGKTMRWGRLKLANALGSEFADLALPIEAQYYNGTSFVTNADDGCTTFPPSAVMFTNFQRNLAACETYLSSPPASITLSAGKSTLILRKPGSGNNGSVDLKPRLSATDTGNACVNALSSSATSANLNYLQSNWGGGGTYDKNPTGRAVFGVPLVPKEFIFFRENY